MALARLRCLQHTPPGPIFGGAKAACSHLAHLPAGTQICQGVGARLSSVPCGLSFVQVLSARRDPGELRGLSFQAPPLSHTHAPTPTHAHIHTPTHTYTPPPPHTHAHTPTPTLSPFMALSHASPLAQNASTQLGTPLCARPSRTLGRGTGQVGSTPGRIEARGGRRIHQGSTQQEDSTAGRVGARGGRGIEQGITEQRDTLRGRVQGEGAHQRNRDSARSNFQEGDADLRKNEQILRLEGSAGTLEDSTATAEDADSEVDQSGLQTGRWAPDSGAHRQGRGDAAKGRGGTEGGPSSHPEFQVLGSEVGRARLDAVLASHLGGVSRAKVQESIKAGLVSVNGRVQTKGSYVVQPRDTVSGRLIPRQPMEAMPEDIQGALDIVFEDSHLLVLNKPPHLVVHPAAGNTSGTLVNALLHHMSAPGIRSWPRSEAAATATATTTGTGHASGHATATEPAAAAAPATRGSTGADGRVTWEAVAWDVVGHEEEGEEEEEEEDDEESEESEEEAMVHDGLDPSDEFGDAPGAYSGRSTKGGSGHSEARGGGGRGSEGVVEVVGLDAIRPGIVHRLDKGTSGLLVVAKDSASEAHLCAQFKARTTQRVYLSILCGTPAARQGVVDAPIGRDPNDRKRMAVLYAASRQKSRKAISRYAVIAELCGGAASLVKWQLGTGRTHQIRVHAKHLGHPVLGDTTYGGMASGLLERIVRAASPEGRQRAKDCLRLVSRPCLHAATLGFMHPHSLEEMHFQAPPPKDFLEVQESLASF